MRYSQAIKPISYLKAHASEIIRDISNNHKTYIITQNGEAKAIVQDVNSYEQTQESLSLLKILTQSKKSLDKGNYKPINKAFNDLKQRTRKS